MGTKLVMEFEIDTEKAAKIQGQPPMTLESLKQLGDMLTAGMEQSPELKAAFKVRYFER